MIFDKYPYTNFHEMNDDWVIQTLREFGQRLDDFVAANQLTYADPIEYNPATTYPANIVVTYNDTAYVSKQVVPAGVIPSDSTSDYWLMIFPFGDLINGAIEDMQGQIDAALTAAGEQLQSAIDGLPAVVDTWLTNHPNVTTTVQPGSISWPKLYSEVQNVILADYDRQPTQSVEFTQQGGIHSETGEEYASADACRTEFLTFPEGVLEMAALDGYTTYVFRYDAEGEYIGYLPVGLIRGFQAVSVKPDEQYRFMIMHGNITPSTVPAGTFMYNMLIPKYADKNDIPVLHIPVTLVRENGYRKADGTIFGTTTQYFHSTFDAQQGDIIILDYVECATNVSVFGYFIDGTYVSKKMGEGGTAVKHLESAPLPADCVVSISGRGADFENTAVQIVRANGEIIQDIAEFTRPILDAYETLQWQFALDTVLCIGDSLTIGVPANTSTMPNPLRQNYPFYLSRMIDTVCTNAGYPGIKTSEWYLNHYSDYTMSDYNAVIIFLGTNGQLTDTLDTDVDPYDDYNDYATTETGYYCKLIEHIQADNSNVIIVLVNVWRVNTGGDTARTVIEKIGQRYNLPVVNTYDLRYDVHPEYHGMSNNVHMAKAGYLALANRIQHALRLYLSEHVNDVNKGMTRQS